VSVDRRKSRVARKQPGANGSRSIASARADSRRFNGVGLLSCFPLLLLALFLAGCSRDIDTIYGQREGSGASGSVNGTAVLGEMCEKAGHHVFSWDALSPRLRQRADCIVWFPNDFKPPSKEVRKWLAKWLTEKDGRTLIYVGRDFDAEPWYWEHVSPDAPPQQKGLVQERLLEAKSLYTARRSQLPKSESCEWFAVESASELRQTKTLSGDSKWLDGVDAAKTDIELRSRIVPPKKAKTLLRSGGDVLVSRQAFGKSNLIVVANGSFLLNLPLVNHEHRKLAGKLIGEIGPPGKTVVFLESSADGPPIRDDDEHSAGMTGLEILNIWPTNWILLQLAVVGVIFCFARWPIFGRPKTCEVADSSDFGRHVDAMGELLERSRDRAYAMERILNYRQRIENE